MKMNHISETHKNKVSLFISLSRILLSEYIPSVPNCLSLVKTNKSSVSGFDQSILHEVINRASDRGITPLHVAALKGHMLTVQVLFDLGAFVAQVIVEDGVRQLKIILAHHLRHLYNLRT
ncbi:BnaA06g19920D [Brassica napus]|uniref:(rape) hypothetical protein n=1 Tax=Brassica napus TaxID=3708 RepID=A0A078FHA2_BRANA|nr:unnamed protein product [Brassica napus]CDY12352.1 BnaA06g19920D [Brassica napus]